MSIIHTKKILLFCACALNVFTMLASEAITLTADIVAEDIDELISKGAQHIEQHGHKTADSNGNRKQLLNASYVLLNPMNRLHQRGCPESIQRFCKQLIVDLNNNTLLPGKDADNKKTDPNSLNPSGYGYYVFHQKVPLTNSTQYDWVIEQFKINHESRKACINFNQPLHKKTESINWPHIEGIQFSIKRIKKETNLKQLSCIVSCLNTDLNTELPYDLGFSSFVTELAFKDLKAKLPDHIAKQLVLGYVKAKTNFSHMHSNTNVSFSLKSDYSLSMPQIDNAQATLQDIYGQTAKTAVMQWLYKYSGLPTPQ